MKHLSRLLIALLLFAGLGNMHAQDENNPWLISFGVNAVDMYPTNEPGQGDWFDEYFNASDHWNIIPALSTVSVSKYVGDGFSIGVRGSLNRIEDFGDTPVDDLAYYGADGHIKYNLNQFLKFNRFDPYLEVGGGYTWVDDIGAGTVNGGVGFNFWFTQNIGLQLQSTYKHVFEDYSTIANPNIQPHFQHTAGIAIKFGGADSDGDGINDKDDECPQVPGVKEFNGCPDSDGDGIQDNKDDCPNEAGPKEHNGCPDSDGDGVINKDDACPNVAGLASLAGCPDADGDGVADKDDDCVNEAGPAANKGCPWPDKDGDGVLDKDDECPDLAGTVANKGCPEVSETVLITITEAAKTILFNTGKSTIKEESYGALNNITNKLKEHPTARFEINGHTDSVGSEANNKRLSEERAASVRTWLINNGIDANRLTSQGFGESQPIATNGTRAGRAQNRRVEMVLIRTKEVIKD